MSICRTHAPKTALTVAGDCIRMRVNGLTGPVHAMPAGTVQEDCRCTPWNGVPVGCKAGRPGGRQPVSYSKQRQGCCVKCTLQLCLLVHSWRQSTAQDVHVYLNGPRTSTTYITCTPGSFRAQRQLSFGTYDSIFYISSGSQCTKVPLKKVKMVWQRCDIRTSGDVFWSTRGFCGVQQ